MEQLPLFELPGPPPAPPRRTDGRVRYTPSHHRTRVLCDDCVRAVHELGFAVAPPPRVVRWRRIEDGTVNRLCQAHKELRMGAER